MEIFFKPLANLLSEKESKIVQHIIKLREDEILSFNQYLIDEIYNKYKIDGSVKINALINSDVEMVQEHNRASVLTGYYEYAVVKYTFGIAGNVNILNYKPKKFKSGINNFYIENSKLILKISTNFGNTDLSDECISNVKSHRDKMIVLINENIKELTDEIQVNNNILKKKIIELLEKRKSDIEKHNALKKKLM